MQEWNQEEWEVTTGVEAKEFRAKKYRAVPVVRVLPKFLH